MTAKKNKKYFSKSMDHLIRKKSILTLLSFHFGYFKTAKLITVFCQTINILSQCNYLFTGIFLYMYLVKEVINAFLNFFVWFFQNGKQNDKFQARRFGLKTK